MKSPYFDLKNARLLICASLALGFAMNSATLAQAQTPTAKEIVDKYIQASGGKEAMEKIKALEIRGKLESGFITMDMVVFQTTDASLMTIAVPGSTDIVRGRKGDIAWASGDNGKIARLEGKQKEQAVQNWRLNEQLDWLNYDGEIRVKGDEEIIVRGELDPVAKPAWHLRFEPKSGTPIDRYFEKKTGLLIKATMVATTGDQEIRTDSYFSDYKDAGGVLMPHKVFQVMEDEREYMFVYEDIQVNPDIPADRFTPPPEDGA